ncbi:enoyl-CoA hydratase [Acrocarpospora pleiomorpha]|uniref:Enoyl-CoA hydratase n=1 Tax=Acrocarpospora pleiomorpha TaxID=90975 RepID=A0A5M3XXU1_9ACTN|nr:enoyl-CoA hydratase/isomerase family protein [Acrocarpospora pleiomorpha]GES25780.1 enoyl-CoA hydratase [Acrocarpospora pleiomorpha]
MTSTNGRADEHAADELVVLDHPARHIARITLNRPDKANIVATPEMNELLARHLRACQSDDDIKVIILAGAGKNFCGGEDINKTPMDSQSIARGDRRPPQSSRIRHINEIEDIWADELLLCDKTVVASVQGAAIGLGFRLALFCDIVVASDDAFFGRPQSRIGLAGLDMGLPVLLSRLGINRGYELLLTGRTVTSQELHEWGFIASVVPRDDLADETMRYAQAIAAHSTDGLMIGRQAMKMFWNLQGLAQWRNFASVAHPLFSNLKWRDDEINLFKERERAASPKEALQAVYRPWTDLGFK